MSIQAVGIDFSERGAVAVGIDENGAVVRRAAGAVADIARLPKDAGATKSTILGVAVDAAHSVAVEATLSKSEPHISSPGTAAVVAESWVGAAKGARHAICLWIGDRVFAGLMLDGKPWSGAHGLAGSAAWLALNPVERQDYRRFGSLAAEVSNSGIARRLCWRIESGDRSRVLDAAGGLDKITAEHVFEGARNGDGVAISVVRDTAKYVGMAIANLASAIDPEIVVLAGDLAGAGDLLFNPIAQECARRLPPSIVPEFRLELSPLGAHGVAIGAARLAALAHDKK
jgi:glucokinase